MRARPRAAPRIEPRSNSAPGLCTHRLRPARNVGMLVRRSSTTPKLRATVTQKASQSALQSMHFVVPVIWVPERSLLLEDSMTIGWFAQRWTIGLVLTSALGFGCTNEAAPDEDPVANEARVKLQNELAAEAALNPATAATVRPVKPTLKCVERLTSSSYRAHFGYVNTSSSSIPIPVGFYNRFFPSPQERGQPTAFAHGTSPDVVQVTFSSSSLIAWILGSGVVTATRNST